MGTCSPDSLFAPLQIQQLADRSDVISEVPKCSKIQICWGSLQRPQKAPSHSLADGEVARCSPPKNPSPRSRSLQSRTNSDIRLHVVAYPVKIIVLVSCPLAPNPGDATLRVGLL